MLWGLVLGSPGRVTSHPTCLALRDCQEHDTLSAQTREVRDTLAPCPHSTFSRVRVHDPSLRGYGTIMAGGTFLAGGMTLGVLGRQMVPQYWGGPNCHHTCPYETEAEGDLTP